MSKFLLALEIAIAIWAAAPAIAFSGGAIDDGERTFLLDQLEHSKSDFLASIAGLTEAEWTYKPSPSVWSVEECAEHIILAEDFIFDAAPAALKTPAVRRPATSTLEHDRGLAARLLDRSSKATAPAQITPSGKIATPAEAARIFTEKRDRHIEYARNTNDDLRTHTAAMPGMGVMDAYQIMLVTAAHSARHTEQIREVQANGGYPRK